MVVVAVVAAVAAGLLVGAARSVDSSPAPAVARPVAVEIDWVGDLAFLAEQLPKKHKNLFFHQPREEWEAKVEELAAQLDGLADHEVVVELMRLVASVGDGHTAVQWFNGPIARKVFPVQFHPFADGLRVVQAPRELAWSLGAEVTAVGGKPIEEAWQRVAEVIAHENEAGVAAVLPQHLETPWIVHALGMGHDVDRATFTVKTEAGEVKELDLGPDGGLSLGKLGAEAKEAPLWRQRRGENYWWTFDATLELLYLQFNRCTDDPNRPFATVVEEIAAQVAKQVPARFVIDLRHNGGGNSLVIQPLFALLGKEKALRAKGCLFVAIGPNTFSSAMMNAVQLRQAYGALLVGEPTGGKPRSYGEIRPLELPSSKLQVMYSTKFFELVPDDAPSVLPDLSAPVHFAQWKEGRDPVLEAIDAAHPRAAAGGK